MLGALGIWLLHDCVPHEHFVRGVEVTPARVLGRHWLFILAITLHNLPEGFSVGVAHATGDAAVGLSVTLAISVQNLPEGLAVAAALVTEGYSRTRAFLVAVATGLVQPLGAVVGVLAVGLADVLLPLGLAAAAGAMLFVISHEVIPESHRRGYETLATMSLVAGFAAMMVVDVALD
jgi:zinc transporter, ZIP family